jgi:hypothetical protein
MTRDTRRYGKVSLVLGLWKDPELFVRKKVSHYNLVMTRVTQTQELIF